MIFISGGIPTLRPERSRSLSLGFDYTPAWVDGLRVSASYFDVYFEDRIATTGVLRAQVSSLTPP
jgi:iron complex outermembrane receptor protein